ncbi:MAG TPA: UDP-N-acetylmuramoyl-L-alanine--D-glutamate ligase [Candidatus Ozemobacteraceae bacterium]
MNLQGRPVSIIGAAKSGLAAAKTLASLGARVLVSDIQPLEKLRQVFRQNAVPETIEIEGGGHTERLLEADFIVLSPGVPTDIPILRQAAERGIPIHSEIEIAYRLSKGRRLVVTGSNGKTTTTTLLAAFCETQFPHVFLGGNIGIPMMEFAAKTPEDAVQVLEVSSFQLETISEFNPDIAMITNFFENHLDRYPSYEAYRRAKERIALNMTGDRVLILNADQESMHELAGRVRCRIAWFGWNPGTRRPCVTIRNKAFVFIREDGAEQHLFDESVVRIIGKHNRENIMAASLAALLAGVEPARLGKVVAEFPGVEHRLEWVRERRGVTWINDSKGTNCAASIIALRACTAPVILIAGGRDKGTDLAEWVAVMRDRVRHAVLYGEARERFRAAMEGVIPLTPVTTLEAAVEKAAGLAVSGDTVLLSPACSSYDLFPNFEVRGARFKELVRGLPE